VLNSIVGVGGLWGPDVIDYSVLPREGRYIGEYLVVSKKIMTD
jgi:hypothetical protein